MDDTKLTIDLPVPDAATVPKTAEPGPRPERIGRYRIERLLGYGGFGAVWLAEDEQLQRRVALKVPHARLLAEADAIGSHLAEARTVAGLDHANIAPVFDVGGTDEFPCFIVSKYIDGNSLASWLSQGRFDLRDAVELTALVAEALHHAHKHGLVHRDIKPSNILLDKSGKPFVADFGLALREQDVGRGPGYVGTPGYMSPEQARGEGHRVDGRSDIFSLGVVFYELLTGARPFAAVNDDELREQIMRVALRPPRQRDDSLPKELERICLKALARRAVDRYTTAKDMADDLWHYLQNPASITRLSVTGGVQPSLAAESVSEQLADTVHPPEPRSQPIRVIPKGLRSFDVHDADFFLELLPGPRDRDGLPDSLRFWKNRIQEKDADATFSVGLIYGPSGCGKSSLVKAGLLPRLSGDVIPVYVEATAHETETRLLHGLRKHCPVGPAFQPDSPAGFGLKETLTAIRQGHGIPSGKKLLIILDQFEQWLHAEAARTSNTAGNCSGDSELIAALRQCDGTRVQCIVLVRDDFWLPVSRFLKDLEIDLLEGQNSALVDLFDPDHARNVLAAFGRAFGKLPQNPREMSKEQAQFLDQAVAGLVQQGKVICVRLALFTEMMKHKAWTPAALKAVGGTAGVGVTFLEETFSAATAPPKHRYHQQAARNVLKALIPESGTDIKGHMRSYQQLLKESGYEDRPQDFADLLRILDGELRLITPTNPESTEDSSSRLRPGEKHYQLTHDYLVHSLRDWLTRKQKETRRGRAEMLLAERAHDWATRPHRRQLPGLLEWLSIRLLTDRRGWTEEQRAMVRAAAGLHGTRLAGLLVVLILIAGGGLYFRAQLDEERSATRADAIVRRLLDAKTAEVPAIVEELEPYRTWANPQLYKVLADPGARSDWKLHARLALLPGDPGQVAPLRESLLQADVMAFPFIRDALRAHRAELTPLFWGMLDAGTTDSRQAFRAAAALASYDPASERWAKSARWVAEQLTSQPSLLLPDWAEAFRPAGKHLLLALLLIMRDHKQANASTVVAELIGQYAADDPPILAEALAYARPNSFAVLFAQFQPHEQEAVTALTTLLDRLPPDEGPSANEIASQRANLAIALLRLGQGERLWPLLKASENPRTRSFAIDRFAALGCPPDLLLARLKVEPEATIRAALWLGVGGFSKLALPVARRLQLRSDLLNVCCEDENAAVHAATLWLLGRWDISVDMGGQRKGWYVNPAGLTMIRFIGPIDFLIGSPGDEPGHDAMEDRRPFQIPNSFDIGMTEVTVGQLERFLRERKISKNPKSSTHSRSPMQVPADIERVATKVPWYRAAEYCNWLSKLEGIPPDQWCYTPNEKGKYEEGMKIVAGYRKKSGYRLPTEAEWEYACRGGALTSRCYGDADELLPRYCWYVANSAEEYQPPARLLPNAFGLFDMHGNAMEWCQDTTGSYDHVLQAGRKQETASSLDLRSVRGGAVYSHARLVRSAKRFGDRPTHLNAGGFRVARSRP